MIALERTNDREGGQVGTDDWSAAWEGGVYFDRGETE